VFLLKNQNPDKSSLAIILFLSQDNDHNKPDRPFLSLDVFNNIR